MPQSERQKRLDQYRGATIIYFEGYHGRLCSRNVYEIVAKGKIGDTPTRTNFQFSAVPKQDGNCQFITMVSTTSY